MLDLGEFDEYLEIWIQFGYVTLFTCIYEWAPVVAFLAIVIEIRNDAHKFCNLLQRPQAAIAEHIGFWDDAFSLLAFLSIPTSVGIAAMKVSFQGVPGLIENLHRAKLIGRAPFYLSMLSYLYASS